MKSNLTQELDLSVLINGGEVQMISFGMYDVSLHLQSDARLQIFCSCEITSPAAVKLCWESGRVNDMTGFYCLLKSEIRSFNIEPAERLTISFSNEFNMAINVGKSGERFEAFIIWEPDGTFTVV